MADEIDNEFLRAEFDQKFLEGFLRFINDEEEDDLPVAAAAVAEPAKKPMTHTEFLYDQCPELRKVMENFAGSDLAYHMEMKDGPGPSDKGPSGQKGPSEQKGPPKPVQPEPPKPVARGRNRAWAF